MEECGGVGLPSLQRGADHFVQDGDWKTAGQKTKAKENTHLVARKMGRHKRGTPWWLRLEALTAIGVSPAHWWRRARLRGSQK